MGAYVPAPLLTASLRHQCMGIVQATVTAMAEEGCPYQGVLYAGVYVCKCACSVFLCAMYTGVSVFMCVVYLIYRVLYKRERRKSIGLLDKNVCDRKTFFMAVTIMMRNSKIENRSSRGNGILVLQ